MLVKLTDEKKKLAESEMRKTKAGGNPFGPLVCILIMLAEDYSSCQGIQDLMDEMQANEREQH